jgi:hypothetical protein
VNDKDGENKDNQADDEKDDEDVFILNSNKDRPRLH